MSVFWQSLQFVQFKNLNCFLYEHRSTPQLSPFEYNFAKDMHTSSNWQQMSHCNASIFSSAIQLQFNDFSIVCRRLHHFCLVRQQFNSSYSPNKIILINNASKNYWMIVWIQSKNLDFSGGLLQAKFSCDSWKQLRLANRTQNLIHIGWYALSCALGHCGCFVGCHAKKWIARIAVELQFLRYCNSLMLVRLFCKVWSQNNRDYVCTICYIKWNWA